MLIILVFQISLGTKSPPQDSSSSPQAAGEQLCKSEFPSPLLSRERQDEVEVVEVGKAYFLGLVCV